MKALTEEQVSEYREQGFIVVDSVLDQQEIADLRRVTDEFVEKSRSVREHNDVYDLEPGHTPDAPMVRRIKLPNLQHEVYDRTLRHPRILDIAEDLIGPGVRLSSTKLNMKAAAVGSPVEWHQDWSFYPHTNDDVLAVGVAIDPMSLDNGCLLAVPGSHLGPIHDHHQDGVFIGAITDRIFSESDYVPIEVPAGGISIHHVRAVHGSAPNRSQSSRRLYLLELCATDAWPLVTFTDLEDFQARVLRGQLSLQPRLKQVPVRIPLPRHSRHGSIYEVQSKLKGSQFN